MTKSDLGIKTNFIMMDSNPTNVIFRRVVSPKGRNIKEIKKIQNSLPTATLHYFSEKDYNRLKEIEAELLTEFYSSEKKETKIKFIKGLIERWLCR